LGILGLQVFSSSLINIANNKASSLISISNKVMVAWGLSDIAMLIVVTAVPFLQPLIKTTSISLSDWLIVLGASFAATFWIEAAKLIRKQKKLSGWLD
jgi:hypothetical protein